MRHILAGRIIFVCDIIALLLGFFISRIFAEYVSIDVIGTSATPMTYEVIQDRLLTFCIESSVALFAFYNRGHYKRIIPWWSQVRFIALTIMMLMLIDGFVYFTAKYQFSRLWIVSTWASIFIFILIARYIAKLIGEYLKIWTKPTIIIGDYNNIIETVFALHSESYTGYEIRTLIIHGGLSAFDKNMLPKQYANIEILDLDIEMDGFINNNKEGFYVLAPDDSRSFKVNDVINKIVSLGGSYALVPPIEGAQLYGSRPQYFFGHDIIFIIPRDSIHSPFGVICKRFVDIIISLGLLIFISPVMMIIALLIKKDGGSAFFAHTRIGKNNKPFKCLKFRSMAVNAEERLNKLLDSDPVLRKEWDTSQKLINDPRVTNLGSLLRKTSLDELPQLINVLKGDMSLVGPRPIVEDEKRHYGDKIKDYLSVRPGVTGLWQVSGRSDASYKHRVYFDSWYVNNWSLWCDFVILVKTPMVLINGRGAY